MACVVTHSTESDPGTCEAVARYLVEMGYEPHEVFDPSNGDGAILLPVTSPGKALVNLPGGVETNRRGDVYQIEIVARAVDVPNYDDVWYERLRVRLTEICAMTGAPYVFPLPFQPYPQSYGKNLVRMTYDEWLVFEGICGHQHVPENDHGDPGALDITRLQPPAKDDDMPDYIIRDARDSNHPWIAVYPDGGLRHIGGDEAGHIIGAVSGIAIIDEHDIPSYERAVKQAGSSI